MMLIGVDYHPSFQTIAFFVEETGECGEQELNHSDGQAERFYRDLKQRGICVRVGSPIHSSKPNSASSRSNQREYPVASMPCGDQGQASEEAEVRP